MNPTTTHQCFECDRLSSIYEAATFEQARIHNAMDTARQLRDLSATRRLTLEAYDVTDRRRSARADLIRHQTAAHEPQSQVA
jgi:hypothetical protein